MMGTIQQVFCIFLGHFIGATSFRYEDALFPQDFERLFENDKLFPFERNLDFFPFDNIFRSWRMWTPDFDTFPEFPPTMNVPRVQVFCDDSKLTLLVDKKSFGLTLTREEIQLGNGCYSNRELPNQFVFVYDLDQCGTTPVLQNGMQAFTNSLNLSLKKATPTLWQALPSVYIYCIPKSLNRDADIVPTPAMNAVSFNIQTMDSSWTNPAESNLYERGKLINLQVSAKIRPHQQLFIQSCSVSASPEPHARPRHAVILNKGCSSSLGSHTVAQFAASNRAAVVNFMLNTSHLISEMYIHCNLVVSDKGVTSVSKSCNYDIIQSRWEELNGDAEVCECCSSKCKGPSAENLPEDVKGMVTIGPLVIVDNIETSPALPELEPQETSSTTQPSSAQLVSPEPAEDIGDSGSSSNELPTSPQGVVVVRQAPTARLTLWLPGQVHTDLGSEIISQSEHLKPSESTSSPETLNELPNEINGKDENYFKEDALDMNGLPEAEWPTQYHETLAERFQRKSRLIRSGKSDVEGAQAASSLPTEISVNLILLKKPKQVVLDSKDVTEESPKWMPAETDLTQNHLRESDFNPVGDEQPQMDAPVMEEDVNVQPIIRSKLEFSKSVDGSQKLSYEEEVKQDAKDRLENCDRDATRRKLETGLKGLRSTFLYLIRRMNKAE